MYKFLSIHFEQHIDNAQLLKINKSHVLQKRIQVFLITTRDFFSNCNEITTCTSTDKWPKQILVDLSFFCGSEVYIFYVLRKALYVEVCTGILLLVGW